MTAQDIEQAQGHDIKDESPKGPKYFLDLEGTEYPWSEPTITVAQIREIAGWTSDQQVMLVNLTTNEEAVLAENTDIELKPGHGFGRKFKFRRGTA